MSKKTSPLRVTLPDEHVVNFWNVVKSLVVPFGVDRVKEVNHYVELLGLAIERHTVEAQFKPSPQKRMTMERKKFIMVFKQRYLQLTDLEYPRVVSGIDTKMIDQTIEAVKDKGFDLDEYLKWVFDIFLQENPKFMPPNLKQTCSQFFLEQFFYANREQIKSRNQEAIKKKELMDLVSRGRLLIRGTKDKSVKEDVKTVLKAYRDSSIGMVEFRKKIETIERIESREE